MRHAIQRTLTIARGQIVVTRQSDRRSIERVDRDVAPVGFANRADRCRAFGRPRSRRNPFDVSRPSEINRTDFWPRQLESNFFIASITSTYGLYGDAEVLAIGIRSELAARLRSVVNGWRTCSVPEVIYPTITREPVRQRPNKFFGDALVRYRHARSNHPVSESQC